MTENIAQYAPDPQSFWDLVKDRFILKTKTERKVSAFWFCTVFWDKHKLKPFWGEWEERLGAIASDLAADYHWLDKKEQFHNKVFTDINKYWKLFDIGTVVKESGTDFSGKSNQQKDFQTGQSGKRVVGKNSPAENVDLPNSFYGGHDRGSFLATELGIQSGIRVRDPADPTGKKWIVRPDYSSTAGSGSSIDKGHSHLTRNIRTKQQPSQKVSQILKLFKMVEFNVNDIFKRYSYHFYGFSYPQGRLEPDPYTGLFRYKTRYEIEAEIPAIARKQTTVVDEGYHPLPEKTWEQKFEAGEQVEEKWILENLRLYREFLEKQALRSSGKNLEMLNRNIDYCKALREGYERPLTWISMEEFDKGMAQISGYETFKQKLRQLYAINRIKSEEVGEEEEEERINQIYKNLTGFPGVGKTMISQLYAETTQRPFVTIGFASQNHPKVIEGISQSYQGAEIGQILAAFVQVRANVTYTIEDLRRELKRLEKLKNVQEGKATERQRYRMDGDNEEDSACLKKHIAWMEQKKITSRSEARFSRAPLIIIDEYEKCGDKPTVRTIGNIATESSCATFFDKFFGFAIDAREMSVFITCNYEFLIEPFIKSRFDAVYIDLPTYSRRIKIAKIFAKKYIRRQFRHKKGELTKQQVEDGMLTDKQKRVLSLFNDEFVKWTIDEGWGVREMDNIYAKEIAVFLRYLDTVRVNNDKSKKTLLDHLIDDKKVLSNTIDRDARFSPSGDGEITLSYFNDSDTTGEKPTLTWSYKRFTETNAEVDTGIQTGYIDSVLRIKGIVINKDGSKDNWFQCQADKLEEIINYCPDWWKNQNDEKVRWRLPLFYEAQLKGKFKKQ